MSKKHLVPISNGAMLLLSIGFMVVGIWMGTRASTGCGTQTAAFDNVMIFAGSFLFSISLAGLIYSCCSWTRFRSVAFILYAIFMVCFVVLALAGTIFAFCVSSKGSGIELPGKGYKEYKLGSYSGWIQAIVKDSGNWNRTKTCMIDAKLCTRFNNKYRNDTVEKFQKERLTSVESGCCKPSNDCGFTYWSPANWTEEKGVYNKNPDCKAWDNDPKVLCLNCESCKAGVADNMKRRLWTAGVVNLVLLISFLILFAVACYAFKNPGDDGGFNLKYCPRVHA